jgi:hypothetical protein
MPIFKKNSENLKKNCKKIWPITTFLYHELKNFVPNFQKTYVWNKFDQSHFFWPLGYQTLRPP